jgi:acyl-CoA synthetase (AMP-forming)/AMP-acid ligase II
VEFNLADLFESLADTVGDRIALVCGDRRLTYSELDARANRLAHHLQAAGVKPGEHVGMYLYNGTEYVEGMLACLKIRAVPINVNYRYVEDELRYLFADADLVGVLHQREFAPRIAAIRADVSKLRTLIAVGAGGGDLDGIGSVEYEVALASQSPVRDFDPRSPDDLFIIYTGGTTGMPKGVMWRQEDLFFTGMGGGNPLGEPVEKAEMIAQNARARDPQIVQFPVAPLIHGAAQLAVFIGFNWGDKVVLIPRFDPDLVWEVAERERVNTMTIVGDAMARPMAEALPNHTHRDLSSVLYVGSAGAILSTAVKEQFREHLPNLIVGENFGATETGHQGMEVMGNSRPEGGGLRFQMKPTTTVLDDALKPLKAGDGLTGRLAMRGRVPLGYYNDVEKTRATFAEIDGERWVMPGDLATIDDDGTIIVFGRGTMCINSGGEKIYPEEVEAALKANPDVFDAVVVGVPDERWGERVTALVQLRPDHAATSEDIATHARTKVAGYKVPRVVHFVDEIARQPSGKPDYPWAKALATKLSEDR